MIKIKYQRKDIIFLALAIYMKIHEDDIITQSVFISLTEEETILITAEMETMYEDDAEECLFPGSDDAITLPPYHTTNNQYDEKYQYLLT
jgi:hypothetical protein